MAETFELKNLLNKEVVKFYATQIKKEYADFKASEFEQIILEQLDSLELKQRSALISNTLYLFLPSSYPKAVKILTHILGDTMWEEGASNEAFKYYPISHFIETYGLEHFEESMRAISELTKRFTGEFAIRPFIIQHHSEAMKQILKWSTHEEFLVRRLSSEGIRPKLPWGESLKQFIEDPSPIFPVLENLKNDDSLYVRKSVANNLNDISKNHPKKVLEHLEKWNQKPSKEITWITKQALRTLIKDGNKKALQLIGYGKANISIESLYLSHKELPFGEKLLFSFDLLNRENKEQPLLIDYVIHYQKANGTLSPKVYKLKLITLKAHEKITIEKQQPFVPISTRKFYNGLHQIDIQINGEVFASKNFELTNV